MMRVGTMYHQVINGAGEKEVTGIASFVDAHTGPIRPLPKLSRAATTYTQNRVWPPCQQRAGQCSHRWLQTGEAGGSTCRRRTMTRMVFIISGLVVMASDDVAKSYWFSDQPLGPAAVAPVALSR